MEIFGKQFSTPQIIFGLVIIIAVVVLGVRFFGGPPRDSWVCSNGQWVKYGNPTEPMPKSACGPQTQSSGSTPSGTTPTKPSTQTAPSAKRTSIVKTTLDYGGAINRYANRRVQFDPNCQAQPISMSLLNGSEIMFDNRSAGGRWIALDGEKYYLDGYGFKIVKLSYPSRELPHVVRVDCGSGVNNAQIILQ